MQMYLTAREPCVILVAHAVVIHAASAGLTSFTGVPSRYTIFQVQLTKLWVNTRGPTGYLGSREIPSSATPAPPNVCPTVPMAVRIDHSTVSRREDMAFYSGYHWLARRGAVV